MKTNTILITLAAIVFASAAIAGGMNKGQSRGPDNPMQPPVYSQLDLDNNGRITETEFNQFRADRIAQRSGKGRHFKGLNENHRFAVMDQNADGVVTEQEFLAHKNNNQMRRSGMGKARSN